MTTNSRGLKISPAHLEERANDLAYVEEMKQATDRRMSRKDKSFTEADAAEYRAIWEKYYGPLPKLNRDDPKD